jgi:riboflavin synthase
MFTGIIEEIGVVKEIHRKASNLRLTIGAGRKMDDILIGDSIAVDGVCLSIVKYDSGYSSSEWVLFESDVSAETISKTTIELYKVGRRVNLERALKIGSRLGGHLVSGHIDGVGEIKRFKRGIDGTYLNIDVPSDLIRYMVYKGSVAVDGVSLTIADVDSLHQGISAISIALIPHTLEITTLGGKKIGDRVNLECDIIGKHVERFVTLTNNTKHQSLDTEFLKTYGYSL